MKSRRGFAGLITAIVLGLIGALSSPGASAAPTFTVNSVVDTVASAPLDNGICQTSPGNSTCTLRAAIMKANHFPGGGVTIVIPAATYGLTIAPTGADDELTGDLNITASMTIQGAGAATTIIDANKIDRVLNVGSAATVTITGVTVRNGSSSSFGGGINSDGSLTLNSAVVSGNRSASGSSGGGIVSLKTLILNNTVVSDNQGGGNGGGIFNSGTATVNNSFISGNLTLNGGYGGGILNNATMTITGSLISGNQTLRGSGVATSGKGGGIWSANGTLTILNSTISNNSALSDGGGIYNEATVFTYFTTIAGNLAANDGANSGTGGGIKNGSGAVNLRTTLVVSNYAGVNPSDLSGTIASQDYNLINLTAGATITGVTTHNIISTNPFLDSLRDNGGVTHTRALLAGSAAVDAVPAAQCSDQFGAPLTTDQRGAQRGNGGCDIGAYEGSISSSLYGRNLIVNGDADTTGGSPTGARIGIPFWAVSDAFTAVPYNAAGGFPNVATDTIPANHGYGFFAGGNAASAFATQTISVSAIGSQIDTGKVAFTFSADLGGYLTDGDSASVIFNFLDGSGTRVGSGAYLPPVTPADRGNKTGFLTRAYQGTVSVGTRSIEVFVDMTRSNGVTDDGYADNISLVLTPPPTLAQISTRMAVRPATTSFSVASLLPAPNRRRLSFAGLDLP
jgi:CSLREA domain-containing protein